jgi:hypothetical protein
VRCNGRAAGDVRRGGFGSHHHRDKAGVEGREGMETNAHAAKLKGRRSMIDEAEYVCSGYGVGRYSQGRKEGL